MTASSATSPARTQPVMPFGFSGNWTKYHVGAQSSPKRCARTANTFGTPLTFLRPNSARRSPSGSRYATARSWTTAA